MEDKQRRRAVAFLLAISDMQQVERAARYLLDDPHPSDENPAPGGHAQDVPWRVRRVLETGLVVSYARPFTKGRLSLGGPPKLTTNDRELHDWLLAQRKQVHAHNDETFYRQVVGLDGEEWRERLRDQAGLSESWLPPSDPAILHGIVALAGKFISTFQDELSRLVESPPNPHRRNSDSATGKPGRGTCQARSDETQLARSCWRQVRPRCRCKQTADTDHHPASVPNPRTRTHHR